MHRLLRVKSESGYSLIEALFQLLVMGIILQFVILFFYWKAPIERQMDDYYATEWELFAMDLQALLIEVEEFNILAGNRSISFVNDRGDIEIGHQGAVIRKLIFKEGFVPLYTNVAQVIFTQEGEELHLEVKMLDGKVRERRFAIGLRQE